MGLKFGSDLDVFVTSSPVKIFPGESQVIVDLVPRDVNAGLYVVSMGVTQHPNTTYTYSQDGTARTVPVPLGEYHNPVMCCRDLGSYLQSYESFRIAVRNNDDIAHYYAAQIWYIAPRIGQNIPGAY